MFVCYTGRQLPVPGFDGQQVELRLGHGQDTDNLRLSFNAAQQKWISEDTCILRTTDQQPIGIDNPTSIDNRGYAGRSYMTQGGIVNATDLANPPNIGQALAGGLSVEYRQAARIKPIGNAGMYVGTFFYALQQGDTTGTIGTNAGYFTTPPTGGTPAAGAYTAGPKPTIFIAVSPARYGLKPAGKPYRALSVIPPGSILPCLPLPPRPACTRQFMPIWTPTDPASIPAP